MTVIDVPAHDLRVGDVVATIGRRVDAIRVGRRYVTLELGPSSADRLGLTVRFQLSDPVSVRRGE